MEIETYEQAVARTGRKWLFRTKDWPCPACGKAECDLDIDLVWYSYKRCIYVYQHQVSQTNNPSCTFPHYAAGDPWSKETFMQDKQQQETQKVVIGLKYECSKCGRWEVLSAGIVRRPLTHCSHCKQEFKPEEITEIKGTPFL